MSGGSVAGGSAAGGQVPSERLWVAVKRIVDRADVEGLLGAGAPGDEYSREVDDLARLAMIPDGPDAAAVRAVWCSWFGEASGLADAQAVELAEALRELGKQSW